MPVIDVQKDLDNRRLIMTAQFAAPVERIWQLYADPRQLEKVWGPPTHPATFVDHDLTPGGRMTYFMTAPDGQKYCGFWDVKEVDEPRSFTFEDGFANEDFTPDTSLPVGSTPTPSAATTTGPARCTRPSTPPSRRCSRCWTWAWSRAPPVPSTRSTPSWPKVDARGPW